MARYSTFDCAADPVNSERTAGVEMILNGRSLAVDGLAAIACSIQVVVAEQSIREGQKVDGDLSRLDRRSLCRRIEDR